MSEETLVVGLTGGICSGKGVISQRLAEFGAEIINADLIGHQIYLPGTDAWKEIIAAWGEDILLPDQTVNRAKLGGIVFGDPKELEKLNAITHPRMYKRIEDDIQAIKARENRPPMIVVEAAILIEANWIPLVDRVWVVVTDYELAMRRLMDRNKLTYQQATARISAQMTNAERYKYAHVILNNNGTIDELKWHIDRAWYKALKIKDPVW
ncbi:MAG: dephospho-CoA kinase [Candidatus Tectomicrobia bacterium]|nr:dephospho-CoA kinase [Candidatus Tectomicrobia bacterium]